ncbi:hypothetical protein ADS46_12540 [Halomonas sp. G11]|nr:hypothetical protein ADS46_12540 [Halomonas sp. G11]
MKALSKTFSCVIMIGKIGLRLSFFLKRRLTPIYGRFILDFLVQDETGFRVGIECDGKEFHEEWRDAMI